MAQAIPSGCEGVIPHLVVEGASKAIEFYRAAFGAEELCRMPAPDGERIMHAEVRLGGKVVYLCDDFPEYCGGKARAPSALGGTPVTIHQYVEDCDAALERARTAGGTVTMETQDTFWGDRYGQVTDPFGHVWSFATHVKDMTPEEIAAGAQAAFGGS